MLEVVDLATKELLEPEVVEELELVALQPLQVQQQVLLEVVVVVALVIRVLLLFEEPQETLIACTSLQR